ncbi:receptor-like protein 7 [Apium graveolens]|uniref:receptor-like protein 7 n=1 Tax=Apium graveolens TaxID=4045 RepID=UPI003D796C48
MKNLVFTWLFLIQLFQIFLVIEITSVSGQCLDDQKSSLLEFKRLLKFNSTASTKLVNWNHKTEDCCKWGGVVCNISSGHVIGLELDRESINAGVDSSSALFKLQYLRKLNLADNKFDAAAILSELFNLTRLTYLNLANNNFNSTEIPSGLFNLTSLTYLNLSNCGFSGQIPRGLSRMTRLDILDLSTSFLYGQSSLKIDIPNLKAIVRNLKALTELYLDGIDMTSQAKSWSQSISSALPNLRVLSLSNSHISGPIDPSIQSLRFLSHLTLNANNLNDSVPEFLANLTYLKVLRLSFCNLQGIFPGRIIQMPTLEELDISENEYLQGSLPELPKNGSLRTLILGFTKFSGVLPESIGNLELLSRMEIRNCNFRGSIPNSMGHLTRLVRIDFSYNNISGHMPLLQNSKNLIYIDFSHNRLSGTIPSTYFEGFVNLVHVDLGFNVLTGEIPSSLFTLQSLQKIKLSQNLFRGLLADFSNASWSQLNTLDLSSNNLNGSIPISLFQLKRLNILSLSFNKLTDSLQLEKFQRLRNLNSLDLSYNNLSLKTSLKISSKSLLPLFATLGLASCKLQSFPNLRNQSRLSKLDLSDNQIGGEIPTWIWNQGNGSLIYLNFSRNQLAGFQEPYVIPRLSVLDLHSNQLSGKIPVPPQTATYVDYSFNNFSSLISPDVGNNLTYAYFFSVSSNKLTGIIPDSLCEAYYLQVLDLSNNGLSGVIPSCLLRRRDSQFPSLGVLNLGNNNLIGYISGISAENCNLRTLDLHANHLEGSVPRSLFSCASLAVLNLGNNRINDTFPCFLKNSSNLRVLVLRNNHFHGDIQCPEPRSNWPQLQIMDISSNQFTGKLPQNLFLNWTSMMKYDDDAAQLKINLLRYNFLETNDFYYQDTVTVTSKGMDVKLVKILKIFKYIDLSSNQFEGNIPETIGELEMLNLLNLSHNAFTGSIPSSFGNLKQLEALDLSVNKIKGTIPRELGSLTFLSSLNLSYNQLAGKIPAAAQFSTFEDKAFKGNKGLCGVPLMKACVQAESDPPLGFDGNQHSRTKVEWDMIAAEIGFSLGWGLVIMPLVFYTRWRMIYYQHIDEALSWIFKKVCPSKKTKKR